MNIERKSRTPWQGVVLGIFGILGIFILMAILWLSIFNPLPGRIEHLGFLVPLVGIPFFLFSPFLVQGIFRGDLWAIHIALLLCFFFSIIFFFLGVIFLVVPKSSYLEVSLFFFFLVILFSWLTYLSLLCRKNSFYQKRRIENGTQKRGLLTFENYFRNIILLLFLIGIALQIVGFYTFYTEASNEYPPSIFHSLATEIEYLLPFFIFQIIFVFLSYFFRFFFYVGIFIILSTIYIIFFHEAPHVRIKTETVFCHAFGGDMESPTVSTDFESGVTVYSYRNSHCKFSFLEERHKILFGETKENRCKEKDDPRILITPEELEKYQIDFRYASKYSLEGSHLCYGKKEVSKIDIDTYHQVDNLVAKDKDTIFFMGIPFSGMDTETYEWFGPNQWYGRDKDSIYYINKKIEGADKNSFIPLSDSYSKDKNNAYYRRMLIPEADVETFEVIEDDYAKDKNAIYYGSQRQERNDTTSFQKIDSVYSIDSENAYYYSENIEGADTKTFEVLESPYYSKDAESVFYTYHKVEKADSNSFSVVIGDLGKDYKHVYFQDKIIEGADPDSFEHIFFQYSKDKNTVFYNGRKMEGSDPNDFEYLGNPGFAISGEFVFYKDEKIGDAQPETFTFLEGHEYAKDTNNVFYLPFHESPVQIEVNNASSFKSLGDSYAKDNKYAYYKGEKIPGVDVGTFTSIRKVENEGYETSKEYAKDKEYVYFKGNILEGADSKSFHLESVLLDNGFWICGVDKNHLYLDGEIIDL
jgi:hypothetical protein